MTDAELDRLAELIARALLERPAAGPFQPQATGVAGIHFYTLNRSPATRALFEILQLSRSVR